ncbi:MAG TPA: isoprenylcysteine carboxylmethyltransferase family protein [Steroidobacteraceae bacterium]|nr:isoprenylcysteine carboxylmethyltransferase family protein [Steroidobacteraceae bacterium]
MVALGNLLYRTRLYVFPLACLLVFLPGPRIWQDDLVAAVLGFAIALAGQVVRAGTIGLVYIVRGGKNRQVYAKDLVTDGVFGHSRNPMYVGNLLILSGMAVTSNCWSTVLVAIPLTAFIYRAIVAAEENYLRGRFGADFDAYCARVPRFVPRLQGLGETFSSMDFRWRRVVVKEYGTPTAWVLVWCAIVAWNLTRHDQAALRPWALPMLEIVAILAVIGWATARILKKTGRVVAD